MVRRRFNLKRFFNGVFQDMVTMMSKLFSDFKQQGCEDAKLYGKESGSR
jgi:hypothetical protein